MAPIHLLEAYLPETRHKISALLVIHVLWILIFASILYRSVVSADVPGFGNPTRLSCVSKLWSNSTNCEINGVACRPFNRSSFPFLCPAGCKDVKVLEPHTIGGQEVNYRSLVIGGADPLQNSGSPFYRGDSFICAAAMHAGIINDWRGGCGVLSRIGEQSNYPSNEANGIPSIGFDSNFPLSFTFAEPKTGIQCRDQQWLLLAASVLFTLLVSIFTTSSAVFFGLIFFCVFCDVALASDPPFFTDYGNVISLAVGRFLPAAFVGLVIYRYCVRRILDSLTAQFEKTVLWLGGCWIGSLHNYTFDRIPISRLTPHDLKQQPGAITALVILVAMLLAIALSQAWAFRIEGRMPRYLALYGLIALLLLLLASVPQMNLRIHHYILALIFLPGTSLQTRPSLLYQGILVGLFINGVARWGFASIIQTPSELLADGQLGSLLPHITAPVISRDNITFVFSKLAESFDGISALANDVERFHGFRVRERDSFTWMRHRDGEPEYFRFGYMKAGSLSGTWFGDFTKARVWERNGSWTHMEPGPS